MSTHEKNIRNPYIVASVLGGIFFIAIVLLALYFWKTRIVYSDTAFVLFEILRTNELTIQANRYGSFVTQLFPLITSRLGGSLDIVVKVYSISFPLFHFAVFLLCAFVLRNHRLALALLFADLMMTMDTFFWVQSELLQAIPWMILTFALIENDIESQRSRWFLLIFSVLLSSLTAFTHPLALVPFVFIAIFLLLNNRSSSRWGILLVVLVYLVTLYIKKRWFQSAYDEQAMLGFDKIEQLFPNYLTLDTNKQFIYNLLHCYQWVPVLFVMVAAFYTYHKRWWHLYTVLGFTIGYVFLVNVSYTGAGAPRYHLEAQYAPLALMIALPLAFDIFPVLIQRRLALPFMTVLFVTFVMRIYFVSGLYNDRIAWLQNVLAKHSNEKLVFPSVNVHNNSMLQMWGTPYEWWLLSTINTSKSASLIVHDNPSSLYGLDKSNVFVTQWGTFEYDILPSHYFNFTDTTSVYRIEDHP